jgi:hypothetical protein
VRWYCVVLAAVSFVDAWLTADEVLGIGPLHGTMSLVVPLAFVLIGDFRYFLFIESACPNGTLAIGARAFGRAAVWTLVVPLGSRLVVLAFELEDPRALFLVYESLFVFLMMCVDAFYLPKRGGAAFSWTRRVTRFVLAYYALWAGADAVILAAGSDLGFLLRVVPNVFYYGGLVPAIAWAAPVQPSS